MGKFASLPFSLSPTLPLILCLAWALIAIYSHRATAEEEAKYELHEISLWGLDPTLEQANELAHYPSAMPGVVDTDRSRANEARKPTPLSVITLHGEPVGDLEIDLRVQSGRFVGHWPPAESKSGRLRWLDLATVREADKDALFATVDEKHWFNDARRLDGLYVKEKSRSERFLTYDVELKYELPVQITGGPDGYQITNSAKHPLADLFVLAPQDSGIRIGHLETLPPSKPKADTKAPETQPEAKPAEKEESEKPSAEKPVDSKPKQGDENKPATEKSPAAAAAPAAAAPAVVVVAAPAAAGAVPVAAAPVAAAPVAAVPGQPAPAQAVKAAVALEPTELPVSPVVAFDSDEFRAVRKTLAEGLLRLGLTQEEIDLLLDRAGSALVEPKETIVVFRLPPEAIEERLPLVAYPAPRKTVRTAFVLVRNIDPKIKDEVQKLIAELGSSDYTSRENAEKRLTELGRLAIPSLKTALKSADLEVVFRAERILLAHNEKLEGT